MDIQLGKPEDVNMCPQRVDLIRERANSWVDGDIHSALVVMAARQGTIVLQDAFGHLSTEPESAPLQLDTIFPIASQSKRLLQRRS